MMRYRRPADRKQCVPFEFMNHLASYVLVTPVRDEEATIGRTIESVLRQTALPREWVIVSDGSTDCTDDIVRRAAERNPWIRLLRLDPRPGRSFAAVVHNTETGIRHLIAGITPISACWTPMWNSSRIISSS